MRPDGVLADGIAAGLDLAASLRLRATLLRLLAALHVAHVLDWDNDLQVQPLLAWRRHDRDRQRAAEERRNLLGRPDGRGEPDALSRPERRALAVGRPQRVQSLE